MYVKSFLTLIITLLITSCVSVKNKNSTKNQKIFIFDFDDTFYSTKNGTYVEFLYESVFQNSKHSPKEVENFIKKQKIKTPQDKVKIVKLIKGKFKVDIVKKNIDYSVLQIDKFQTKGFGDIIKKLISDGHKVTIIGGGSYGCAVIPDFVKQFGIKKEDIYSGYFKDFSNESMAIGLFDKFRYVNCEKPDDKTPYSENKSDLIKLLKNQGKISGKITHIGDGKNDLEVWQDGVIDNFIGFGLNQIDKKVEKEAPIFVKNISELEKEINIVLKKN